MNGGVVITEVIREGFIRCGSISSMREFATHLESVGVVITDKSWKEFRKVWSSNMMSWKFAYHFLLEDGYKIESYYSEEDSSSYVICMICEERFRTIEGSHLKCCHNMTFSEYVNCFPDAKTICDEVRLMLKKPKSELHRKRIGESNLGVSRGLGRKQSSEHASKRLSWNSDNEKRMEANKKLSQSLIGNKNAFGHVKSAETIAKNNTPESAAKQSRTIARLIVEGKWNSRGWCKVYRRYSEKNLRLIRCHGSYEERAFQILEFDLNVLAYIEQPLFIDAGVLNYIPDFLVLMNDGSLILIEVKPNYMVDDPRNIIKFQAAIEYCEENEMTFEVWTEDTLFR